MLSLSADVNRRGQAGEAVNAIVEVAVPPRDDRPPVSVMLVVSRFVRSTGLFEGVRNAMATVVRRLDDRDWLGLVTVGSTVTVDMPLARMTDDGKEALLAAVGRLRPDARSSAAGGLFTGIRALRGMDLDVADVTQFRYFRSIKRADGCYEVELLVSFDGESLEVYALDLSSLLKAVRYKLPAPYDQLTRRTAVRRDDLLVLPVAAAAAPAPVPPQGCVPDAAGDFEFALQFGVRDGVFFARCVLPDGVTMLPGLLRRAVVEVGGLTRKMSGPGPSSAAVAGRGDDWTADAEPLVLVPPVAEPEPYTGVQDRLPARAFSAPARGQVDSFQIWVDSYYCAGPLRVLVDFRTTAGEGATEFRQLRVRLHGRPLGDARLRLELHPFFRTRPVDTRVPLVQGRQAVTLRVRDPDVAHVERLEAFDAELAARDERRRGLAALGRCFGHVYSFLARRARGRLASCAKVWFSICDAASAQQLRVSSRCGVEAVVLVTAGSWVSEQGTRAVTDKLRQLNQGTPVHAVLVGDAGPGGRDGAGAAAAAAAAAADNSEQSDTHSSEQLHNVAVSTGGWVYRSAGVGAQPVGVALASCFGGLLSTAAAGVALALAPAPGLRIEAVATPLATRREGLAVIVEMADLQEEERRHVLVQLRPAEGEGDFEDAPLDPRLPLLTATARYVDVGAAGHQTVQQRFAYGADELVAEPPALSHFQRYAALLSLGTTVKHALWGVSERSGCSLAARVVNPTLLAQQLQEATAAGAPSPTADELQYVQFLAAEAGRIGSTAKYGPARVCTTSTAAALGAYALVCERDDRFFTTSKRKMLAAGYRDEHR